MPLALILIRAFPLTTSCLPSITHTFWKTCGGKAGRAKNLYLLAPLFLPQCCFFCCRRVKKWTHHTNCRMPLPAKHIIKPLVSCLGAALTDRRRSENCGETLPSCWEGNKIGIGSLCSEQWRNTRSRPSMHSSNPELLHSCLIGKSAYSFKKASIKKFLPAAILDSFTLPAEVRLFFPPLPVIRQQLQACLYLLQTKLSVTKTQQLWERRGITNC